MVCGRFKLTIDESKTKPRQTVLVKIFISVLSVPFLLNSPPAQHGSYEHQIITVAAAAQSLFHLNIQNTESISAVFVSFKTTWLDRCLVTFHLVDLGPVLQAVVKRVSGQTSGYRQHGQNTPEHGTQDQHFAQTRVT